jgi:hypothetical protein
MSAPPSNTVGWLALIWGFGGVLALLGRGLGRLIPVAAEALTSNLTAGHWAFLAVWLLFMGYTEGYRGFHQRFAPRVASRALWLAHHPRPLHLLLAPFFCTGLFHANRRRLITSWSLVIGIPLLVIVVRALPSPWRGLVDAGVVLGLGWGWASTLIYSVLGAIRGLDYDPQLPAAAAIAE